MVGRRARCRNIGAGQQCLPPDRRRATDVLGAHDRRPRTGHRGKRRLGRQSDGGRPHEHWQDGLHAIQGVHMVDGAGHWAHEEQPEQAGELLTGFLREYA